MNTKSYQKMFKAALATTVATGAIVAAVPSFVQANENGFKDLDTTQDYYPDLLSLVERGIVKGFPDGTFKPYNPVTRGQAAKILANALNLDTKNVTDPGFSDVKKTDEYYGAIAALANAEIISGYPDKTFGQANKLTRSQMAKIIAIGFKLPEEKLADSRFLDVKEGDEFSGYIQSLLTNGITKGTTATTFSPRKPVTRAQMTSFIVRSEKAIANTSKEKTATIESFTKDTIVLSTGTFPILADLIGLLDLSNAKALKGAIVKYSLASDATVKIHSVELTANGTSTEKIVLDGRNLSLPGNLIVSGDYVIVKNLTIKGDIEISKAVENSFLGKDVTVEGNTIISDETVVAAVAQASSNKIYKSLAFVLSVSDMNATLAENKIVPSIIFENSKLNIVSVSRNHVSIRLLGNTKLKRLITISNNFLEIGAGVNVPVIEIGGSGDVSIEGEGKVGALNIGSSVIFITLGPKIAIDNITFSLGSRAEEIIKNFDKVKENILKINGKPNKDAKQETPPVTDYTPE